MTNYNQLFKKTCWISFKTNLKLKTNHYFLTIQQNNKTDTECKNSLIRNYFKIEDYCKTRLTNKPGKTIHLTR